MKRLIVMLTAFVFVSAPLIAGIWMLIEPRYQARGEVRVRPVIPRLVFKTDDNGVIPFYDAFVNTQVSMIRSPTVLQRVLDQPEVQGTQWYENPRPSLVERWREKPPTAVERLRAGLSVQPRPETEIIEISFAALNAQDAKLIVDAVLDEYVKYTKEMTNAEDDRLYRQLTDQYGSLENQIKGQENACARLRQSLGTQSPEELLSRKGMRLDEMQARLNELHSRIAVLQWEIQQAASGEGGGVSDPADSQFQRQPKYHEDAEWRQRDIAVRTIRHNIAVADLDPNNPETVRVHKDLEFAKELLQLREAQLDEQWRDRMAAQPVPEVARNHELARAQQEEQLLRCAYEAEQKEFAGLFASAQMLDKETTTLQHKRELFNAVRQRLDQKNIERNVPGSIVTTPAFSSSKPDQDRRLAFSGGALALGLLAAAVVRLLMRKTRVHKAG